jgi:preprotein translocase subunit SecF
MDIIKPGRVIDFMGMRRFWIFFSAALVIASAVLLWKPGPRFGIDFKGGTEVTVRFDRTVDASAVRGALTRLGFGGAEVVPSGDRNHPNQFIVRVEKTTSVSDNDVRRAARAARERLSAETPPLQLLEFRMSPGGDHAIIQVSGNKTDTAIADLARAAGLNVRGTVALRVGQPEERRWQVPLVSIGDEMVSGLERELHTHATLLASVWVSPRAGAELRNQAIRAVLYSIVFIMIYIAFRFDLRFAPGGILGLFHDAMVTLGFFVVTQKEVTISTVAAILMVVGYSMNDTVIVYDRIRENLAKRRGLRMLDVINHSVSEMFSRTIVTSTTVILSMVPFTIWGSGVIRDFAWAMIVGVVGGTYSSIYVAAPLTEWIDSRWFHPPTASGTTGSGGGGGSTSGSGGRGGKGSQRASAQAA